ncbi:hypothetical protein LCGC14_0258110 [marine sediment metagenome]|uniref:Uncharacterized protein n=1 Tax=marine sediment metagenome TaxID=412755 RepID=A0A0F9UJ44_9ZZZZ
MTLKKCPRPECNGEGTGEAWPDSYVSCTNQICWFYHNESPRSVWQALLRTPEPGISREDIDGEDVFTVGTCRLVGCGGSRAMRGDSGVSHCVECGDSYYPESKAK